MNYQAIRDQISTMSTEDLKRLNSAIVNQINYRRSLELERAKGELYQGARCSVNHPKAAGKIFIVDKIKQKNVSCYEEGNPLSKWNVTATLLEIL